LESGICDFRRLRRLAYALLKGTFVINPAVLERARPTDFRDGFWMRLLTDEELRDYDDLQKLVIGCEIIAALDALDLVAAQPSDRPQVK